jgi:hypothetical protein
MQLTTRDKTPKHHVTDELRKEHRSKLYGENCKLKPIRKGVRIERIKEAASIIESELVGTPT